MSVIHKIGRRKAAVARVFLSPGNGEITINGRPLNEYFTTGSLQYKVQQPFILTDTLNQYNVMASAQGGGLTGQAEALRLGISRCLCEVNAENRPPLKVEGLLTRDPRMVERKKFGQKKARKRFQFSKR